MTGEGRFVSSMLYLCWFWKDPAFSRYSLLEAKHGRLDPLASVSLAPQETVMMTVVCDDKEDVFDIPTKQTIGESYHSGIFTSAKLKLSAPCISVIV